MAFKVTQMATVSVRPARGRKAVLYTADYLRRSALKPWRGIIPICRSSALLKLPLLVWREVK